MMAHLRCKVRISNLFTRWHCTNNPLLVARQNYVVYRRFLVTLLEGRGKLSIINISHAQSSLIYMKMGMLMTSQFFILQTKQVLGYCFYTVSQLRQGVGQQPLLQGEDWEVMKSISELQF